MATAVVAPLALTVVMGCWDAPPEDRHHTPLQPLVYTEDPELTPQGAAVREQRLERQLLEGAAGGQWGRFEASDSQELPTIDRLGTLGEVLTEALVQRDERLWEHAFVSADAYAELMNVDAHSAAEFVDNTIGDSLGVWESFQPIRPSELPGEGFDEQLEFERFDPGQPRQFDGTPVDAHSDADQFTDGHLVVRHRPSDAMFEFPVARVVLIGEADDTPPELRVASPIGLAPRFTTFLEVGLHLDARLLRVDEHPFPLGVGSFWRYRRYRLDDQPEQRTHDILEERLDQVSGGVEADELVVEVREVSNYGPIRLVEFLHSYEDRRHTRARQWWVVSPRRSYRCNRSCRDNIEDVNWLLDYFDNTTPLMKFPPELGAQWGDQQHPDTPGVSVDERWHQVHTPAGTFAGSYLVEHTGPLQPGNRYLRGVEVDEYFAVGRGVVRREIEPRGDALEDIPVVEELVEYRLMD